MLWYHYVSYFFGALLLTNAIPHSVSGMMGRPFQSPFAKPPGEGLSSSTVNVLWGGFNLAVGYLLLCQVGSFDIRNAAHIAVVGCAFIAGSLMHARAFGRFNGGHEPVGVTSLVGSEPAKRMLSERPSVLEVSQMTDTTSPPTIELHSPLAFTVTLARLTEVLEGAGMTIFARVDHQAAAAQVGLSMPPTTVLIYGNPRGGTPLMVEAPACALDLPLRVLVRADTGGATLVSFHPALAITRAFGLSDERAVGLAKSQTLITNAISAAR
jgi:uncharacterized protein (DUF302 family)